MTQYPWHTRDELTQAIWAVKTQTRHDGKKNTWRDVARRLYSLVDEKEINRMAAILWKLVKKPWYNPSRNICRRLGIVEPIPMLPCPIHGIVHCYDCETEQVKPRRNGTAPARKRTPPIRIGEATEEEFEIIMSLTPDERRKRLVRGGRDV